MYLIREPSSLAHKSRIAIVPANALGGILMYDNIIPGV